MKKLKLEYISVDDLKEMKTNTRIHSEDQIDMIQESMKAFGFTAPILITKENVIMAGHARLKAAIKVGLKEVPVIRFDFTGIDAEAYNIADNKHTLNSDVDLPKLKDQLQKLDDQNVNMKAIGYTNKELEALMTQIHYEPEEEYPEREPKAITCPECNHVFYQ